MTLEDAKEVARLLGYADAGCPYCVADLVERANKLFPLYKWESSGEDVREDIGDGIKECRMVVTVRPSSVSSGSKPKDRMSREDFIVTIGMIDADGYEEEQQALLEHEESLRNDADIFERGYDAANRT